MKKTTILMLVAATLMTACGDKNAANGEKDNESSAVFNEESLLGEWTMTAYGDSATVMGVRLSADGKAESINMPTMPYEHWEMTRDSNTIVITGKSIMDDEQVDIADTMTIDPETGKMTNIAIPEIVYKKK